MEKEHLIEKYFLGTLKPKEQEEFENLLETDSFFKEQYEFEKSVQKVLKSEQRELLKNKLEQLELLQNSKVKTSWFKSNGVSIAASIIVIFTLSIFAYIISNRTTTNKLYVSYYEKYPNTVAPIIRSGEESLTLEQMAFKAYETDQDIEAVKLFLELKEKQKSEYLNFYLAQCYLNMNKDDEAMDLLEANIKNDTNFASVSKWYLALLFLKNNNTEKAKFLLQQISLEKKYNYIVAEELLQKLN